MRPSAALVGVTLAALASACGASDAPDGAPATSSARPSAGPSGALGASSDPSSLADPATLSGRNVLAQAVAVVRGQDAETYQWLAPPHPRETSVEISAVWTAATGEAVGRIRVYDYETRKSSEIGVVRTAGQVYLQKTRTCYVGGSSSSAPGVADEVGSLLAAPGDVLGSMLPRSWDGYTLTMSATIPMRQLAPVLEIAAGSTGVPVGDLVGRVPAAVTFTAEGAVDTVAVHSEEIRRRLHNLLGQERLDHYLTTFDDLQFKDLGPTSPLSPPNRDSLAPEPGQGCDAPTS